VVLEVVVLIVVLAATVAMDLLGLVAAVAELVLLLQEGVAEMAEMV
jgi:hypothetical protein